MLIDRQKGDYIVGREIPEPCKFVQSRCDGWSTVAISYDNCHTRLVAVGLQLYGPSILV